MLSAEEILNSQTFHYGTCTVLVNPNGAVHFLSEEWKRRGSTKLWKTRPKDFSISVLHGRSGYGEITNWTAPFYHADTSDECAVVQYHAQKHS